MGRLYIKQKEKISSYSLAQWHNTRPEERGAAVRTMGNVDISNTPRFHILPEPMSQSSKNMLPQHLLGRRGSVTKGTVRQHIFTSLAHGF